MGRAQQQIQLQDRAQSKWMNRFEDAVDKVDRPAWKKFILSMLALAAAFVLAVYSSVFAQQGAVLITGLCASMALFLAGYVAFTVVPYLARRTRVEWLRVTMDYKLTREGIVFILLIFVIAIAALNTGNNLLYLILSSMLAAILMSGIFSLSVLSGVELELLLPEHVFARRPVPARIHLHNDKKRMPSFSVTLSGTGTPLSTASASPAKNTISVKRGVKLLLIGVGIGIPSALFVSALVFISTQRYGVRVRDFGLFAALYVGVVIVAGLILYRISLKRRTGSLPASTANEHGASASRRILPYPLYFPFLPGGGTLSRAVELEFPGRGLYREDGFALSTRFPFGFLEKKLRMPVRRDLWVYPAVTPTEEFYEILPMLSGEMEAYHKGRGHDLYSIRDMQPTDSARHVDWKASARTLVPKVREFAREDERRLELVFDRRIGKAAGSEMRRRFEAAVEFCACLAWYFHEANAQIQFRCEEFETSPSRMSEAVYDILKFLSAVEPSLDEPEASVSLGDQPHVFQIVCTALPRGSVPTDMWSRAYFVFFDKLNPLPEPATSRTI